MQQTYKMHVLQVGENDIDLAIVAKWIKTKGNGSYIIEVTKEDEENKPTQIGQES